MSDKVTDFPQYRKLSNDKVFYCITGDRDFEEIQIIGSKAQKFKMKAEQYPEILRIQDMLQLAIEGYVHSSREEYENLLDKYALRD